MKVGYVYIMSNLKKTTFYIGVTSDLQRRVAEHKEGIGSVFTKKYKFHYLVYFERILGIETSDKKGNAIKKLEA